MIKIRYVAELSFEAEGLSFRLPAAVAPWVKRKAVAHSGGEQSKLFILRLNSVIYELYSDIQTVTETAEVGGEAPGTTSLSIGISMPSDIRSIKCPTHPVKIKVRQQKQRQSCFRLYADGKGPRGALNFRLSAPIGSPTCRLHGFANKFSPSVTLGLP